ncbi:MAG TPA: hypothetical protein VF883_22560 [Thermoanaerobaculia bacterium]|jgi:hypothetical protein
MAELDQIAAMLQRQKDDLRELKEMTAARRCDTADLVGKIEDLRQRAEETQRRFEASISESPSKATKYLQRTPVS